MQTSIPHNHTATSIAAADSKRGSAMTDERYVETFILNCGLRGCSCDEFEAATGFLHQNASARFHSLSSKGVIRFEGEVRPTRSGRSARIFIHRSLIP